MSVTPEQNLQIRVNLALKFGDSMSVVELQKLLNWITTPSTTLVQATQYDVGAKRGQ